MAKLDRIDRVRACERVVIPRYSDAQQCSHLVRMWFGLSLTVPFS